MYQEDLRKLRLFLRELCKRYNINFTLCIQECKSSFDVKEEIQLRIKDNEEQLFYSEIPICPVTNTMIEDTIRDLRIIFKYPSSDIQ